MPKLSPQQIFGGPLWPTLEQGRFLPSRIISVGTLPQNSNLQILSSSTNRAGLIWSTSNAQPVFLSNNPMSAVNQGFLLPNQAGYLPMPIWLVGDCIQQEWHVFTSLLNATFGFIEVLFPDKQ